jgi:hypothetical protein
MLGITSKASLGNNIYDQDWDLLIILDSCRIDALRMIAHEYEFVNKIDNVISVGSTSTEWMAKTFTQNYIVEISRTAYITANSNFFPIFKKNVAPPINMIVPFYPSLRSYGTLSAEDFGYVDEIYQYGWDDSAGTVLPSTVTRRAVSAKRSNSADRYIVHYMQPHAPFIGAENPRNDIFQKFKNGEIAREEVFEQYIATLRFVLDEVEILLNNFDAEKVVITADHGEAFGELSLYSHTISSPHPVVKCVPWIQTNSTDKYTIKGNIPANNHEYDIKQQLIDLGYK